MPLCGVVHEHDAAVDTAIAAADEPHLHAGPVAHTRERLARDLERLLVSLEQCGGKLRQRHVGSVGAFEQFVKRLTVAVRQRARRETGEGLIGPLYPPLSIGDDDRGGGPFRDQRKPLCFAHRGRKTLVQATKFGPLCIDELGRTTEPLDDKRLRQRDHRPKADEHRDGGQDGTLPMRVRGAGIEISVQPGHRQPPHEPHQTRRDCQHHGRALRPEEEVGDGNRNHQDRCTRSRAVGDAHQQRADHPVCDRERRAVPEVEQLRLHRNERKERQRDVQAREQRPRIG